MRRAALGGQPRALARVRSVGFLDQVDGADGNQIILVFAGAVEFLDI
jgi:hypothetical protein